VRLRPRLHVGPEPEHTLPGCLLEERGAVDGVLRAVNRLIDDEGVDLDALVDYLRLWERFRPVFKSVERKGG
jgi:hypothetical protein